MKKYACFWLCLGIVFIPWLGGCKAPAPDHAAAECAAPALDQTTPTFEALYQPFEHGFMVWRSDKNCAYALATDKDQETSIIIPEELGPYKYCLDVVSSIESSDEDAASVPPPGLIAPTKALGEVWRYYREVQVQLGYATQPETCYHAIIPPPKDTLPMNGLLNTMPEISLPDGRMLFCGARGATAGTCVLTTPED